MKRILIFSIIMVFCISFSSYAQKTKTNTTSKKETTQPVKKDNENKKAPDSKKINKANEKEVSTNQSEISFFKLKYTKDQVWEIPSGDEPAKAGHVWLMNIIGPAREHNGTNNKLIDWGKNGDRYMMFSLEKGDAINFTVTDEVNECVHALSVRLFERNGKLVKKVYMVHNICVGDKGYVVILRNSDDYFFLFFSKAPVKLNDEIDNFVFVQMVYKLTELEINK